MIATTSKNRRIDYHPINHSFRIRIYSERITNLSYRTRKRKEKLSKNAIGSATPQLPASYRNYATSCLYEKYIKCPTLVDVVRKHSIKMECLFFVGFIHSESILENSEYFWIRRNLSERYLKKMKRKRWLFFPFLIICKNKTNFFFLTEYNRFASHNRKYAKRCDSTYF